MKDLDDFVFKNLQCTAAALAKVRYLLFLNEGYLWGRKSQSVRSETNPIGWYSRWDWQSTIESQSTSSSHRRVQLLLSLLWKGSSFSRMFYYLIQYADELVPILVGALYAVPNMKWLDDGLVNKHDSNKFFFLMIHSNSDVPIQEQFAFCFNTSLSDLAAQLPAHRDTIVKAQIDALACSTSVLVDKLLKSESSESHNKSALFCSHFQKGYLGHVMKVVCYIVGLLRSLGRHSNDPTFPLMSFIFPLTFQKFDGYVPALSTDENATNEGAPSATLKKLNRMYNMSVFFNWIN